MGAARGRVVDLDHRPAGAPGVRRAVAAADDERAARDDGRARPVRAADQEAGEELRAARHDAPPRVPHRRQRGRHVAEGVQLDRPLGALLDDDRNEPAHVGWRDGGEVCRVGAVHRGDAVPVVAERRRRHHRAAARVVPEGDARGGRITGRGRVEALHVEHDPDLPCHGRAARRAHREPGDREARVVRAAPVHTHQRVGASQHAAAAVGRVGPQIDQHAAAVEEPRVDVAAGVRRRAGVGTIDARSVGAPLAGGAVSVGGAAVHAGARAARAAGGQEGKNRGEEGGASDHGRERRAADW